MLSKGTYASETGFFKHMDTDIVLNNGVLMPRIGLGTYKSRGMDVRNTVAWAIETKIRLIDTASIYKVASPPCYAKILMTIQNTTPGSRAKQQHLLQNEDEMRSALKGGSAEKDIFISSKISPYEVGPLELNRHVLPAANGIADTSYQTGKHGCLYQGNTSRR
jgi:diketogulonate reductase-like aldo/keto reductase